MKKSILRIISMVLSIALLAGCINVGVFATGNSGMLTLSGSVSGITDAKIIAGSDVGSGLTDGEKAVLHCTALVGNEHVIIAPTDDDKADLIKIDKENKTVEVKNYVSGGYTWKPAKVQLVYGDNQTKDITLDANGKGVIDYDGNTYSVEVTYVASVAIADETVDTLVNAPAYLANGIVNMEAVAALAGDMKTLAEYTETLYSLTKTAGGLAENELETAIIALRNDCIANSTATEKKFKINTLIEAYNAAENKTEYMIENGKEFKETFETYYANLNACASDSQWDNLIYLANYMASMYESLDPAQYATWKANAEKLELARGFLVGWRDTAASINSSNWEFLNHELVKDDATPAELSALNDAVLALAAGGEVAYHTVEHLAEYPAATVTLKQGVDQFNVTVKVQANVVTGQTADSAALTPVVSEKTVVVTLDKGAAKADVIAAIKATGVIDDAIAIWAADEATNKYNIGEVFYAIKDYAGLGDTLTSDVTCTVTFEPNSYKLDFCGTVKDVPYGYVQTLQTYFAVNGDASKSYDYKVNGAGMREGLTYRVVGDTVITRAEGKKTDAYLIREVVANSYKPGASLATDAKSVLYATALNSDSIYYRTPVGLDEQLVEVKTIDETNYKVTAELLSSGLESGAYWVPVGGYLLNGSAKIDGVSLNFYDTETNRVADINYAGTFTEVKVEYQLVVASSDVKGLTDDYVNLPHTLVTEAGKQQSLMGSLTGSVRTNLNSIAGQMANILFTLMANDTTAGLSEVTKQAATDMKKACLDANGNFYILEYLNAYANAGSNGNKLAYLYTGTNSEKIKAEIAKLTEYLVIIVEDPKLPDFIITNIGAAGKTPEEAQEYIDKLDGLGGDLASLNLNDLDVNSYINREAGLADLQTLGAAIDAAKGDTKDFGTGNSIVLTETLSGTVSGMKRIVVNISVYDSKGTLVGGQIAATGSLTFTVGEKFTQNDINKLNTLISELDASLTIDKALYSCNEVNLPAVGDEFTGSMTISINYAPKSYTVNVAGEAQTIYSDNTTVTLPACTVSGSKYVYTVPGRPAVEVGSEAAQITFSAEELKTLFTGGVLNITRESVVLSREDLITFVDALNDAFKSAGLNVSFSARENASGEIVLVLNVDASVMKQGQDALMGAVSNMATALTTSAYVGLGGYDFWDANTVSISLQSLINMVADSDLGISKLASAINANGNITPMNLGGYNVIAGGSAVGTELITTTLAHNDKANVYDLYVTMTGDAATLKELDGTLETVESFVGFECGNGMFNLSVNAPDVVYALYLAQMAVTGRADLTDVSAMNTKDNLAYEISLIKDLFADPDFTLASIKATAAKAGQTLNLPITEDNFELIRKVVNYLLTNVTLEGDDTYYTGSLSFIIRDKLVGLGVDSALLDFVKEAGADSEGIKVDFSVSVNGLDEEYEALVVDYSASGYLGKFYVTKDLATVLEKLNENAVVVLLGDVVLGKTATIKNKVFINLNGFTINGDMVAEGAVRIVDSLASTECGAVNGNLSGNFVITGGKYSCDVTSMLPKGYEVTETGYVSNALYTVVEENGNVTINLSADFLDKTNFPDIKSMLVDVAFDVALNMFTNAQMAIDGEEIYNIALDDVVGQIDNFMTELANTALDFIDWTALTSFISKVAADVYDFAALKAAIEAGTPVASYEYSAKVWEVSPLRVENGYITLDIGATDEDAKSGTISIVVVGDTAELAALCDGLAKTVTVNDLYITVTDVECGALDVNSMKAEIEIEYEASASIDVDFSSNHNYAALIGTAVAYAMPAGEAKTNLVKALDTYFTSANGDIEALAAAIDNVTAAQFIAAIKALSSTTCETMLTKLGLTSAAVVELEAVYGDLLDIAGAVLAKLEITGPASKLSAIKVAGTYYEYAFVRENVKGYNVDIAFTLKLFTEQEEAPEIVINDPVIDLGVSSDIVAGWEVAGDTIFVDITPNGWSVEDVTHIIFNAPGADKVVLSVLDREDNEKKAGLICNGDKVKVVASNANGSVEAVYTVIIIGDTNADGITNIGDAYAIAQHYTGVKTLDAQGLLAADLNGDGAINVGDTYKIAIKYTSWDDNSYDSDLENK